MKARIIVLIIVLGFVSSSWEFAERALKNEKSEIVNSKKFARRKADVEINFCLLNKHGERSTQFSAGENFTFSLMLENNSGDTLYLDNSFLTDGNGFCAVYTIDGKLIGQPFACNGAQIVSSDNHPFYGDQKKYTLDIPWSDHRSFWSTLHHNFKGLKQAILPSGKYYTVFKHRFCFDRKSDKPSLCLQPVEQRIEFEVK